jgi:DNA-3-methyladenine glycosylase II
MAEPKLFDKKTLRKASAHLRKSDRTMAKIIKSVGNIDPEWGTRDPYEAIVRSFIFQQISGSAGASIIKKFMAIYGGRLPTPREFLKTPEKMVRAAGISPQKYSYLKDFCQRLEGRQLDLHSLADLPDEEVIAVLDDVRGIGRWTAEMFLMFSLGRTDVFAMDDIGLQNAVARAYGLRKKPSRERLAEMSKKWVPYRSVASLYLWSSTDIANEE